MSLPGYMSLGLRPLEACPLGPSSAVLKDCLYLLIIPGGVIRSGAHIGIRVFFFFPTGLPSFDKGCAQTTLGKPFP